MKVFRVFVLLLIALLLPIRGAVAATMLCAPSGQGGAMTATTAHAHHGSHDDPADAAHDHHAHELRAHDLQAHEGHLADGSDDGAKSDACSLCASGCHAAVLLTALPTTPAAPAPAAAMFPAVAVPPLDFQADGPERPPRTR